MLRHRVIKSWCEAYTDPNQSSPTAGSYTINLNNQWQLSTSKPNPDSILYDGVYESFSNYNSNSNHATMTITITGYKKFSLYIRSYAESNYDYVMVGQLDKAITGSTSYSSSDVKAHTRGNQQSGTALSSYTLVEFDNMTGGTHTITIVYRKDNSQHSGDDRGYLLISKNNEGYVDDEGSGDDGNNGGSVDIKNYLTIVALEDGLTASLSVNACEYCVDGDGNWKTLSADTATESINSGHTLSFRGELTPASSNGIGTFTISKRCNLKGNCMSMLFGDNAADNFSLTYKHQAFRSLFENCTNIVNVSENFLPATTLEGYCYFNMFFNCTSLVTAPELPATTLKGTCYANMFYNCTSLTAAPALHATTLAYACYDSMFYKCTSLVTAPELPATTLANSCYNSMFSNCTSVTAAPALHATTLADYCYDSMFSNCTSLTAAPVLPATTLNQYCYFNMFYKCTSLVTAPELPATTLANNCYNRMFYNCSNINYIKMLATDISASKCLYNWVYGISNTGTFVKNSAMTILPTGDSGIPSGWTVQDA